MNKVLTYSTWGIASLLVVFTFLTSQSYTQLSIAILLYPIVVFAAFKIFSGPDKSDTIPMSHADPSNGTPTNLNPVAKVDVVDIEKRSFLKLVGTMGVALFFSSLLGERVGNILFGKNIIPSTPQPALEPSVTSQNITEGYKITEVAEGEVSYYGFTNHKGGWLIMRDQTDTSSFRYVKGDSNFPKSWAERETLKYDYFYNL
jgi:hypothetical protein